MRSLSLESALRTWSRLSLFRQPNGVESRSPQDHYHVRSGVMRCELIYSCWPDVMRTEYLYLFWIWGYEVWVFIPTLAWCYKDWVFVLTLAWCYEDWVWCSCWPYVTRTEWDTHDDLTLKGLSLILTLTWRYKDESDTPLSWHHKDEFDTQLTYHYKEKSVTPLSWRHRTSSESLLP